MHAEVLLYVSNSRMPETMFSHKHTHLFSPYPLGHYLVRVEVDVVEVEVAKAAALTQQGQAVLQDAAGVLHVQAGPDLAQAPLAPQVQLLQPAQLGHRSQQAGCRWPLHLYLCTHVKN